MGNYKVFWEPGDQGIDEIGEFIEIELGMELLKRG